MHATTLKAGHLEARSSEAESLLRTRIREGTWPPGHTFSWPQVAEEFGLSATEMVGVLAPALRRMRKDGLIESRPYVGVRVVVQGESWSPPASDLTHDEYIEKVLRERLSGGFYKAGERFTPLADLAEEFGVSVATIRMSVKALRRLGVLVVIGSNRTFVSPGLAEISQEELLAPPVRRKPGTARLRAFGEQRTLAKWADDERCVVDRTVLYTRYAHGWNLERALTTPKSDSHKHPVKDHARPGPAGKSNSRARKIILARIYDGTYSAGTVISPTDLALRFGIAESGVLDALRDLHSIRIIDHHAGVGYFVTQTQPRQPFTGPEAPPLNPLDRPSVPRPGGRREAQDPTARAGVPAPAADAAGRTAADALPEWQQILQDLPAYKPGEYLAGEDAAEFRDGVARSYQAGGTVEGISGETGRSRWAVGTALNKAGVRRRPPGSVNRAGWIKPETLSADRLSGEKLSHFIARVIRERISEGTYRPGEKIPVGIAVAEEFGVSVHTANEAIRMLKTQRVLDSSRAVPRGTAPTAQAPVHGAPVSRSAVHGSAPRRRAVS